MTRMNRTTTCVTLMNFEGRGVWWLTILSGSSSSTGWLFGTECVVRICRIGGGISISVSSSVAAGFVRFDERLDCCVTVVCLVVADAVRSEVI